MKFEPSIRRTAVGLVILAAVDFLWLCVGIIAERRDRD